MDAASKEGMKEAFHNLLNPRNAPTHMWTRAFFLYFSFFCKNHGALSVI